MKFYFKYMTEQHFLRIILFLVNSFGKWIGQNLYMSLMQQLSNKIDAYVMKFVDLYFFPYCEIA